MDPTVKVKTVRPDEAEIKANKAKALAGAAPPGPGGQMSILNFLSRKPRVGAVAEPQRTSADAETKTPAPVQSSWKGHYGWDMLGNCHIPYIYRSSEKFVAVRMVEIKLLNKYLNYLHADIYSCICIRSYYITEIEARLLNEINNIHCDGQFGRESFTQKDLVVRLSDAYEFFNFLDVCHNKLLQGTTNNKDKCGFIRINKELVVSYMVRDNQKFVPLFYFEGETDNLKLKADQLKGWDLSYIKFCCKVQGIRNELFASETCSVISLSDITSYFPPGTEFEEYWPNKVLGSQLLISAKGAVRGGGQWMRAPPAPPTGVGVNVGSGAGVNFSAVCNTSNRGRRADTQRHTPSSTAMQVDHDGLSAAAVQALSNGWNLPGTLTQAQTQQVLRVAQHETMAEPPYQPHSSPERWEMSSPREDDACESPEAPPYSPVTSPERRESLPRMDEQASPRSAPRDRSRSPLGSSFSSESSPVVLRIFDENGVPLDSDVEISFLAPDTHSLYVSPGERDRDVRNRRTSGRRSGRRGVRGVRGQSGCRGGYPNRGLKGGHKWKLGHPLNEIWTNDEEVSPELVSLVTDVSRRRKMSLQDGARVERNDEREDASESENDDEFLDASDGADTLPILEGQNLHFEWSSMETFQGQEENFKPERTGSVHVFNSAYDAFRAYWDDGVLELIATETNLYASKITSSAFKAEWFPTNLHEILCLFSFWMMLGIVRMPTVTSCFSVDPLLKTEVFKRIFTRRRYEMLTRALHFIDSDSAMNTPNPSNTSARSSDRIHRLRPILTHLNSAFQSNYILSKNICIDESLTLWKGRSSIRQYIRNKASKFGIKTFELCESTTGYLWSFIVYTGKESTTELEQSPGTLKSTAVVKKLIGPLLNKGYRLFMDNWYNSPLLARFLKLNGTDCVGTLRASRNDVPVLINKAPLQRGEYISRHSGDVTVLAWQDKKRITMISTCHGSSTAMPTVSSRQSFRPVLFKPQVVLDYNKFMGGVDLKDQMLEPYLLERKRCRKWYMKLFKRLLNVSILNSRTLLRSSTQKYFDHLGFRLQLVDSILAKHLSHCPLSRKYTVSSSVSSHSQPNRFSNSKHWPVLLEPTEYTSARNRVFRKRCFVCLQEGRKNQSTPYCCEFCRVPLCIKDCFKSYHTSSK